MILTPLPLVLLYVYDTSPCFTAHVQLLPISMLHAGGHLAAVLSMSAGAVSFTHIIKASEPVASTVIGPFFGVEVQVRTTFMHMSGMMTAVALVYL